MESELPLLGVLCQNFVFLGFGFFLELFFLFLLTIFLGFFHDFFCVEGIIFDVQHFEDLFPLSKELEFKSIFLIIGDLLERTLYAAATVLKFEMGLIAFNEGMASDGGGGA